MGRGWTTVLVLAVSVLMLASGFAMGAAAQEATPEVTAPMASVTLRDVAGTDVGTATLTEDGEQHVTITVEVSGLTPGEHGIHVHETGLCDPSGDQPFSSAGGHFNPTDGVHDGPPTLGTPSAMVGTPVANVHAGDLGNITADAGGNATLQIMTDRFTLSAGPTSLQDGDGSALVIHADRDDLTSQPSGESGGRVVCGEVYPPQGTPSASPVAGA
jgi:superoxide dismutase, Cu-Zn family